MEPEFVLQSFSACLSPFEKEEVAKYSQIYFVSDIYHKILAREEQEYEDERYARSLYKEESDNLIEETTWW